MPSPPYTRREALKLTGAALTGGVLSLRSAAEPGSSTVTGLVAGQAKAAEVGNEVLRAGGNAIDAAVAAALTAAVAAPQQCGIGGYGGHMMIALGQAKKVTAIDFNSAAPAAAPPEMVAADAEGNFPAQ